MKKKRSLKVLQDFFSRHMISIILGVSSVIALYLIVAVHSQINDIQKANSILQMDVSQINNDVNNMNNSIKKINKTLIEMQSKKNELDIQIEKLNKENERMESQKRNFHPEIEDFADSLYDKEQKIKTLTLPQFLEIALAGLENGGLLQDSLT